MGWSMLLLLELQVEASALTDSWIVFADSMERDVTCHAAANSLQAATCLKHHLHPGKCLVKLDSGSKHKSKTKRTCICFG